MVKRSFLCGPEALEGRHVMAGMPFTPFTGRDTNDFYMRPALREGDPVNPQWNMEKIRATDVWNVYSGNSSSVVAVEDYGLDYRHEDFGASATTQGQLWDYGKIFAPDGINFEFSKKGRDDYHDVVNPNRTVTLDPNWNAHTLPDAGQYYGNIGAGIIGAKTNNSLGVAGVNWNVQLYSSKVVVNDTTSHDIIAERANRTVQYLRLGIVDQNQAGWWQNNPNPQLIRAVSFGYSSSTDYGDIFHEYAPVSEDAPDGAGHYDFVALGWGISQVAPDGAKSGILVTVPTGDDDKTWPTNHYIEGTWSPWTPWTVWNPSWTAEDRKKLLAPGNFSNPADPNLPDPDRRGTPPIPHIPRRDPYVTPRLPSVYSPGNPDNVIAVAATDINDQPWSRNAKNPIDIYAPGVNIVSVGEQASVYDMSSGTRQAQAHVAGAISLLYDVANQHGFNPTYHQVREAIIEGGDDIGLARPRLNIVNSIKYLSLLLGEDLTVRPSPISTSVTIKGGAFREYDAGTNPATFTLQLGRSIPAPITIGVKIEDGTATVADGDYVLPNPSGIVQVTIPAGSSSASFTVNVVGDQRVEPNETFIARIVTVPSNVKSGLGATATWTILNDDSPPTVSLRAARAVEGSDIRPGTARVMAVLSKPSNLPVTVQYSVVGGTAAAGSDFVMPAGSRSVTFPANTVQVPIDVRLVGDAIPEDDETFSVQIDSAVNATFKVNPTATVTILDDDKILINLIPAMQAAVPGANAAITFTVKLSRAPSAAEGPLTVNFATLDGTGMTPARAGIDYVQTSGTLTFNPGQDTQTVVVTLLPRRANERYPKDFSLRLTAPSAMGMLGPGITQKSVLGRIS